MGRLDAKRPLVAFEHVGKRYCTEDNEHSESSAPGRIRGNRLKGEWLNSSSQQVRFFSARLEVLEPRTTQVLFAPFDTPLM